MVLVIDVLQGAERLADFPQMGRVVPEFNDLHIRELLLGNYRLVYRIREELVEIIAMYHGSRLLPPEVLQ